MFDQIFVVKIRHSSLLCKEPLLTFTNKPQDGGKGSKRDRRKWYTHVTWIYIYVIQNCNTNVYKKRNRRIISPKRQTTNNSQNTVCKNVDINNHQWSRWLPLHSFLSRSLLDCTVGARSAKLKVSTRASTKRVFASPESADLVSALGHVFRSFVSGAPAWIPHWLKCSGRTAWRCLALASHGTWKLSREASSAGLSQWNLRTYPQRVLRFHLLGQKRCV